MLATGVQVLTHREIGRLDACVIRELCVLILRYRYVQHVVQTSNLYLPRYFIYTDVILSINFINWQSQINNILNI